MNIYEPLEHAFPSPSTCLSQSVKTSSGRTDSSRFLRATRKIMKDEAAAKIAATADHTAAVISSLWAALVPTVNQEGKVVTLSVGAGHP